MSSVQTTHLTPARPAGLLSGTTIGEDTTRRHVHKYETKNPLQRWLLRRFHRKVRGLIDEAAPHRVLDFGCGEGYFWSRLREFGPLPPEVVGLDLRQEAVDAARSRLPGLTFVCEDLFRFAESASPFDMVVASEILEHLYDPGRYLEQLCRLSRHSVLLTVPHEPYFRLCNLLRGRDLPRLGNHPEHVQQWGVRSFRRFAERYLAVERVETSFPFILLLGRVRG